SSTMAPGLGPIFSVSQPALSPSETKQMSWLSGFCATCRPRRSASARTCSLGVTQRKYRMCQLTLGQYAQNVRLVFAVIGGSMHLDETVGIGVQGGVMPGDHAVETQCQCAV